MFYEQGQYSQAQINDLPMPWWADVLQDIPGIPTGIGVNATRTGNTLLYGARGSGKHVSQIGGMFKNTLNPAALFRFNTDDFITNPASTMKKGGAYTPYGAAAIGNAVLRSRGKEEIFEQGFLGRVNAASKLNNMSAERFASRVAGGGNTFHGFSPKFAASVGGTDAMAALGPQGMSRASLLAGGRFSGFMAGAMEFSQTGKVWGVNTRAANEAMKAAGKPMSRQAGKGIGAAARIAKAAKAPGAGTGAKLMGRGLNAAGYIGIAASYANPFFYAMLAYDVGKLSVKGVGYAARVAVDAYKSYTGGLNTRIGGGGFVETEASLTSRSRGVAAIQNSRLNARSVLGAEAASMSTYFG